MNDPAQPPEAALYSEVAEQAGKIVSDFVARQSASWLRVYDDELGLARAFSDMLAKLAANPAQVAEMQFKLWTDCLSLWQHAVRRMAGCKEPPVIEPAAGDRRFRHADWQQNFLFDYIKQS